MIFILVLFVLLILAIAELVKNTPADVAILFAIIFFILSPVFALKAKIGTTDEKKIEDFKPTLATPIRTILIWGISVDVASCFVMEGISDNILMCFFIFAMLFALYTELAEKFLTYEEYEHTEYYSGFTATFSKKQWLFLFLFVISTIASFVFYDKAFLLSESFGRMFFAVWVLFPLLLFFKEHISTKSLRFLFVCITCVVAI